HGGIVERYRRGTQRDRGQVGDRVDHRAGWADDYLLIGGAEVAGGAVVGIAVVGGIPLVRAGHRARDRQRVAGWRRVGAVAADRDGLGVYQGAAQVEGEGDGALRVVVPR